MDPDVLTGYNIGKCVYVCVSVCVCVCVSVCVCVVMIVIMMMMIILILLQYYITLYNYKIGNFDIPYLMNRAKALEKKHPELKRFADIGVCVL